MKSLSTREIFTFFYANVGKHQRYDKRGSFITRPAKLGETILTIVSGVLETMNTVTVPSYIVRNVSIGGFAECYILEHDNFKKRYSFGKKTYKIDNKTWTEAFPTGSILAFQYRDDESFTFIAPWGAEMICQKYDWLATPINGKPNDIYRIESQTFVDTYL